MEVMTPFLEALRLIVPASVFVAAPPRCASVYGSNAAVCGGGADECGGGQRRRATSASSTPRTKVADES
eukprot:1384844-Rhodomonas_salina.2